MGWAERHDRLLRACADPDRGFGRSVVYTPQDGSAVPLTAPFDAAFESVGVEAGVPVASTSPTLWLRGSDLPAAPREGDTFEVVGIGMFRVAVAQEDGQGGWMISAHEDS